MNKHRHEVIDLNNKIGQMEKSYSEIKQELLDKKDQIEGKNNEIHKLNHVIQSNSEAVKKLTQDFDSFKENTEKKTQSSQNEYNILKSKLD